MSAAHPHGHETGGLGDEALALVAAAQTWLARTLPVTGAELPVGSAAECAWCPVCQVIASLRGERPELARRLGETQHALAGLLRAAADLLTTAGEATAGHATAGQATAGHAGAGHGSAASDASSGSADQGPAPADRPAATPAEQPSARRSRTVQRIVLDEVI